MESVAGWAAVDQIDLLRERGHDGEHRVDLGARRRIQAQGANPSGGPCRSAAIRASTAWS
jgi:hypothetical protein